MEYTCNECHADYDMLLLHQHAGFSGETQLVLLFLQQPPLYMWKKWSHSLHTPFTNEKLNATRNKHFQFGV